MEKKSSIRRKNAQNPKGQIQGGKSKKTGKTGNPYFDDIHGSLLEVIDSLEKGKKLTCREVTFPEPPEEMSADKIIDLRENKLHMSQNLFALLLNVSPKTVQSWEQSLNTPSGAALRLLWMAQNKPEFFKSIISIKHKTGK